MENKAITEQTISLESVELEFKNWRENRKNTREPIPEALLQHAGQLCYTHGIVKVSKVLRVHYMTLKKQTEIKSNRIITKKPKEKRSTTSDFVEVKLDRQENLQTETICKVTIKKEAGLSIEIEFSKEPSKSLVEVLKSFIG